MKRIALVIAALVAIAGVSWSGTTSGQDATGDRVSALETQVARLDHRVTVIEGATRIATLAATPGAEGHVLSGSIILKGSKSIWPSSNVSCHGTDGFDDLVEGAQVLVLNGSGDILVVGRLQDGLSLSTYQCQFHFRVPNVPDSPIYTVRVGNRNGPTYSADDLDALNWTVELSIG
jgi:hypothetical protein